MTFQKLFNNPNSPIQKAPSDDASIVELKKMIGRFVPTSLDVPISGLSEGDQKALVKLIEAAHILNKIYMSQIWEENLATFEHLKNDQSELGRARMHYYWLNKGPWSETDQSKAFIPNIPQKPLGANYYPSDMSKDEFESWIKTLEVNEQKQAKDFFSVIVRRMSEDATDQKGPLSIVPYSDAYKSYLSPVISLLREAAALTTNNSLKQYLTLRADALISNDYYESDIAWMELDAPLDITFGPYETYDDGLFGYKASFEAYINLRDDAETEKLACFSHYLQEIEDNLPIDPKYRNPKIGALSPIRVVNEIFASGQQSVQTSAYNLPNDKRVVSEKGAKRVMLKNIQEAKFNNILFPIAQQVLSLSELKDLNFDAFFTHILAHEFSHGLGPQAILVEGRNTSPRTELKENYSAIEEAKADVLGLFMLQYLLDQQKAQKISQEVLTITERQLYLTYFAGMFRTMRFGIEESHGRGMVMQFNYLRDKGAIDCDANGKFSLVWDKVKAAFLDLAHDLLMLEATGDYLGAKQLLETKATIRPELEKSLTKMQTIPIDIEPVFVTAKKLVPEVIESGMEFEKKIDIESQKIQLSSSFFATEKKNNATDTESMLNNVSYLT